MTRTEIERIAVLETKVDAVAVVLDKIDLRLETTLDQHDARLVVLEAVVAAETAQAQLRQRYLSISRGGLVLLIAASNAAVAALVAAHGLLAQ
jgi:hypothetical protein